MTSEQTAALAAPFDAKQVKYRDGAFGQRLSYVEGHAVIQRLNKILGNDWSFAVVEHWLEREADEVIVKGRLQVGRVVKEGFGNSSITRARDSQQIVDFGADLKAAATDALKKAATLMGVGLHLYADDGEDDVLPHPVDSPAPRASESDPSRHASSAEKGNGHPSYEGERRSRLSQKQHSYILKLANEGGLTKSQISRYCQQCFGVVLDFISRQQASSLIDDLRHHRIHPGQAA